MQVVYEHSASDLLKLVDSGLQTTKKSDWTRFIPFVFLHAGIIGVFWSGWSVTAVALAFFLYWARMFAITAFYHRYFSHRAFKTSRLNQFFFAVWAMLSVQRGPLWWASHHRLHHRVTERDEDPHSPVRHGLFWSHIGWMADPANMQTNYDRVKDLARYPELVFLNRFDWLVPLVFSVILYAVGDWLGARYPQLHTSGFQWIVWGFFISTVALFHGTCTINSLAHLFGSRRYDTPDESRNNFWLALITLGEGWHNNHHQYSATARQGFYWWEIDVTYYILKLMSAVGLIHGLNPVPAQAYQAAPKRSAQAG